ncbi:MAG: YfiT family bacillithiol transferase [Acidobacteriaceae bacterium]
MKDASVNDDLRYPIGKFAWPTHLSIDERAAAVQSIAGAPGDLRDAIDGLYESQIETPYREGGWTVRQTIHHVADSHMQAVARTRLALTEEWPTITPYKENLWAELADVRSVPVETSLQLLDALHARWVALLDSLPDADWTERGYKHPESGNQTLEQIVALYAWHGRHHTAHITALRERMGW